MESGHSLNLNVQNALDCISENFNLKNVPVGACTRNSIKKCAVCSDDVRHRAHTATVYYVSRPPLSQNSPSARAHCPRKFFSTLENLLSRDIVSICYYSHILIKSAVLREFTIWSGAFHFFRPPH